MSVCTCQVADMSVCTCQVADMSVCTCQVAGMSVAEEWMLWADEKTVNRNSQKGVCPKIERKRGYNTKMFYCYYTQSTEENHGVLCI